MNKEQLVSVIKNAIIADLSSHGVRGWAGESSVPLDSIIEVFFDIERGLGIFCFDSETWYGVHYDKGSSTLELYEGYFSHSAVMRVHVDEDKENGE